MIGLIGRKLGMTQVYSEEGLLIPVTVLEAGPCPILQVKTVEKDGYSAVQVGFGERKEKRTTKAEKGHAAKFGARAPRWLRELRVADGAECRPGDTLTVEQVEIGSLVDVVGTSKGKGFQGVVKRHGFSGGPASHGSKTGNLPGSIGASAWPSHVIKGRKLPGQMGNRRITARNLRVVRVDSDRNLLLVEGSVPGGSNGFVVIRPAGAGRKGAGQKGK